MAAVTCLPADRAANAANVDHAPAYTTIEKEWIRTAPEIRVTITLGTAPIQFFDNGGTAAGVAVGWLERIADTSGLRFVYNRGGSLKILEDKVRSDKTDIICSLPEQHSQSFKQYPMSEVFLTSRTVLVVNNEVNAQDLSDKNCAAIRDSPLPKGIKAENAIYFPSRVDCLVAVDAGEADYCFSNEFSIAYYTVRKNFKRLTTIPLKQEPREYRLVYANSDDILVSVMNKTMALISPSEMQGVILESMSKITPEISLSNIFDIYGVEITSSISVVILLAIIAFARQMLNRKNKEAEEFAERARRDSLTGLYNFAATKELISERLETMGREQLCAFVMMDIDKFKSINDTFGHYEGDQVLMAFAEALAISFRKSDIKGRLGGDEFCVFMDVVTEDVVRNCCERLRGVITKIAHDRNKNIVTTRIGITMAKKGYTFDELYKIADGALYNVKHAGRNSVGFAGK